MTITPDKMCFGLTEKLDTESFACFLRIAGEKEFAETLAKRLSSEEILQYVDNFTALLRKHFSEEEYHSLFLKDQATGHHTENKD